MGAFMWLPTPGLSEPRPVGRGNYLWITYILFLTTQGHGEPSRMSNQLNPGATSETTRTLKTIHTIHSHIHSSKADMRGMIIIAKWYSESHVGVKLPDFCFEVRKKPKRLHPGNFSRPGIEPGPTAWQACMLPPDPQRWISHIILH